MTAPYEIVILDVGGTNLVVPFRRAGQSEPEQLGAVGRAYAGNQYSSVFAEYMVVPLTSAPISAATYAQIKALFALGAQVDCQGGAAGNVFEGYPGIVKCSAKITGEMQTAGNRWVINITLTEVGVAFSGVALSTLFLLTSVDSPDSSDPSVRLSTPDGFYPGDASSGIDLLSGVTVPTGGSVAPTTPEISWLSVPLNAAVASGVPYVRLEAAMTGVYSGTTVWAIMDVMAKIYQMRGASVIAGPFSTNYGGVGLGGSVIVLSASSAVVLSLQTGDQFLVELYPRLALQPGQSDNSQRQSIAFGTIPGPRPMPILGIGGIITSV